MNLQSRIKIANGRCVELAQTVRRLEELIRPSYDFWLHEEQVSEHLFWTAMFLEDEPEFRSMGKGTSSIQSQAGALAEGAEWLTARDTAHLPGYVAAHQREITGPAIPIEDLVAHIATATPPVIERIRNLDDAQHWVDGYSLIAQAPVKVPIEYVRLIGGPNGKASGNFVEEAIVHATNEVFERRAQITVLRSRLVVPTIDIDSIGHRVIREQIAFVQERGIEVVLKDLSFGGVLPCIGAYFFDPGLPADYQFHHFFKVGASFDREEALLRTFTEYTQGRRQDEFIDAGADAAQQQARLLQHDFRRLRTQDDDCDNFLAAFMFGMLPYRNADFLRAGEVIEFDRGPCHRDCLDDIAHAREICEALGKDYVVVDLTDPEIGFPVVQVVIPGYSDVLPFHPASSHGLFKAWTRPDVLRAYEVG